MSKHADSKTLLKKKAKIIGLESFLGMEVWGNGIRREGGIIKHLDLAPGLFTDMSMEDNGYCQGRGV